MPHDPKNFDALVKDCESFLSEAQLKAHFTLYQGYVKKLNEIEERLGKADSALANYSFSEYSELRRREPVAYNGTVLHELYFQNLGKKSQPIPTSLKNAATQSFGSWERLIVDIKGIVGSGHGWCLINYDWNFHQLRSVLVQSEHHVGLLPNQSTLIAIDAWEHAYFMDYGTKKADYLSGVLEHLNWTQIEARFADTPLYKKLSSS